VSDSEIEIRLGGFVDFVCARSTRRIATVAEVVSMYSESYAPERDFLAFTRGFTQSQAFVRHFGRHAPIRRHTDELLFDTTDFATTNAQGESYTYAREYD